MEFKSEEITEIAKALAKVQGSNLLAKEDGKNPHFRSKYATLTELWSAARKPLTEQGLSVTQIISMEGAQSVLITLLMHTSGQWLKSITPLNPVKAGPQEMGSYITYMRRYSFAALVGIAPGDADDDGEKAQEDFRKTEKKAESKPDLYPKVEQMVKSFALETEALRDFIKEEAARFALSAGDLLGSALQTPDLFLKSYAEWLNRNGQESQ